MFNKKELNDDNSYKGEGRCKNCGFNQAFIIPLGKTVLEYAHNIKCDICENNIWVVKVY